MPQKKKQPDKSIQDISVIDLILIDHRFIKKCIEVFLDDNAEKRKKLLMAKDFLDAIQKHSLAERKAIYAPLEPHEELHFNILEAEIEHGMIDKKVKNLKAKIANARVLKDEVEVEFKVLAELLQNHLREEESEVLPKMQEELDEATLTQLGLDFMKLRRMSPKDIMDYPHLEDELIHWKDSVQKISSQFLTKMDKYVENLKH